MALPVQSLSVGSENETVTFSVQRESEINRPNYFLYWLHLIKYKNYIFLLAPAMFVLTKNFVDDRLFDPVSFLFTFLSSLLIFAGFNIRTDFNDHVSGWDRVFPMRSPKPIQLGWIRAGEAAHLSWFLFLLGFGICVPAFFKQTELIRVAIVMAAIFFGGRLLNRNSFKSKEVGEIAFLLLAGPGLASAYQVGLGGGVDTEILAFGVLWGFAILFLVHLNNFVHLVDSERFGLENAMIKYGFDRSKKFLAAWWIVFLGLWTIYHMFYAATYMTWFTSGLLAFWSIPMLIQIIEIQSPLGSDLYYSQDKGKLTFLLMVFLLIFESLWYSLIKLGWISF